MTSGKDESKDQEEEYKNEGREMIRKIIKNSGPIKKLSVKIKKPSIVLSNLKTFGCFMLDAFGIMIVQNSDKFIWEEFSTNIWDDFNENK